ncbi:unnamed protein product [Trichobilharzia regenti]|nr:unnamed protein product [Trichobilharzia regenti]
MKFFIRSLLIFFSLLIHVVLLLLLLCSASFLVPYLKLDPSAHRHNIFHCPVIKEVVSASNDGNATSGGPVRLTCGHAISRDAFNSLASGDRRLGILCLLYVVWCAQALCDHQFVLLFLFILLRFLSLIGLCLLSC